MRIDENGEEYYEHNDVVEVLGNKYIVYGYKGHCHLSGIGVSNRHCLNKIEGSSTAGKIRHIIGEEASDASSLDGCFPEVKNLDILNKVIKAFHNITV